ncbi:hypothetical protein M885DRAFT_609962 [Pelagophyceae sp. CCMP2097]|nr:hypothetical protein M885DRAFT_609962 [Pelagophyceae sp. CCMP2097]
MSPARNVWSSALEAAPLAASLAAPEAALALGFVWDENYERLEAYKADHGDCLVPRLFVTADGYKLGSWVNTRREKRKGSALNGRPNTLAA